MPEREAAGVRVGQVVVVTTEGAAGEHKGADARISPSITEQNRTLLIEAEIPNEGATLRPGAFAKAEIVVAGDIRVITVPASSVVTFAGVEKVFTVDKGKAVEVDRAAEPEEAPDLMEALKASLAERRSEAPRRRRRRTSSTKHRTQRKAARR